MVAARRTPIGTAGRSLARVHLTDLLSPVLRAVLDDVGDDRPPVADVLVGNCRGPGGNPARVAALAAGLGVDVPAVTVDRQCGSGLEAIHQAAAAVLAGGADLVLAGGAESASTADPGRAVFAPADLGDPDMGPAAESVAEQCGITRERQDAYAARSHRLALAAAEEGAFDAELVRLPSLGADERPRRITETTLARLPAAFRPGGTVTAGNSCGVSDGAAVVAVVPEHVRAALGVPGLALRGWVAVGLDPNTPGLGPVPAVRSLLARTATDLDDVDVVEMTEAFAAQVLASTDALGLDPLGNDGSRVCPQGGAIALGHPWGASGAVLVVRLFTQLVRADGPSLGIATCAIGGGQGLALLAERVGP